MSTEHDRNASEARQPGRYDMVMYGDSITANIRDMLPTQWKSVMYDPFWTGMRVAFWGVPGNVVADLSDRLIGGSERPRKDPKVITFLIGTNDLGRGQSPLEELERLIRWTQNTMKSRILVMALLPTTRYATNETNKKIKRLATKLGVTYVDCGTSLDPSDPTASPDGLHWYPKAYVSIMDCLKRAVVSALGPEKIVGV